MRRRLHLVVPLCVASAALGVDATAHPAPPHAAVADVTGVARPTRARWENRLARPVRVFIRPAPEIDGWRPELADAAWASFSRWAGGGVPVRFVRARAAATSDVVIEWVSSLPGNCIGKTWREDVGGEITSARLTLAVRDHRGRLLSADIRRGAVLHEIGHLLGLDHVGERDSIMYPQVWVTDVSEADRAELRDLYRIGLHAAAD